MASHGHVPALDEAEAACILVLIPMKCVATHVDLASAAYPQRLIFRIFRNVISPHKQGSFDFPRMRLAFFRGLPD
jgi:hypothetical protein